MCDILQREIKICIVYEPMTMGLYALVPRLIKCRKLGRKRRTQPYHSSRKYPQLRWYDARRIIPWYSQSYTSRMRANSRPAVMIITTRQSCSYMIALGPKSRLTRHVGEISTQPETQHTRPGRDQVNQT